MKKIISLVAIIAFMAFCGEKEQAQDEAGGAPQEPGKVVFDTTCMPCHGLTGEGDGPAGKNLNPKPRNFKTEPFKYGESLAAVTKTIAEGSPKAPTMVPFKNTLTPEQIDAVAKYVLKLAGKPVQ
ncbi:MAG: cytochrome c [Spirochaetia bacterium]|nr:cytochrome c [Spirochaetia bacterium]